MAETSQQKQNERALLYLRSRKMYNELAAYLARMHAEIVNASEQTPLMLAEDTEKTQTHYALPTVPVRRPD